MANVKRRENESVSSPGGSGWERSASDPFASMIRSLMRWDPFGDMPAMGSTGSFPNVEVKETKDALVFQADLPGLKEEDVDVQLIGNRLTISGHRDEEARDEGDRYYAYERHYGSFSRSFTLPQSADLEQIEADLRDGVLCVRVAKKADVKPRSIGIGRGSAGARGGAEAKSAGEAGKGKGKGKEEKAA